MTLALDGVGGQRHAPAAFTSGKDPLPIVQEAGWAPGPVWTGAENSPNRDSIPGLSNYWSLCVFLYSIYASVQYITIIIMIPNNMNKKNNVPFSDFCSAGSSIQFVTTDS
jgi:hypothetical protein